eukprot:TRINITY_DN2666_c0_g1_i5.p1 TRINITY_DN2666_c0_g1~~TRINITY_DN2666_c0_g1_i5.p1  ORF type:complete len:423 (-),score=44.14 TRINITY_DN2666_c0_g1_i5:78-1346(-)
MIALFPYQDNSTGVSLIENFQPERKDVNQEGQFEQFIALEDFQEHYPCASNYNNQQTCYGQIYFYPQKKDDASTQFVKFREAVSNQLLRYDFEIQTTKSFTATNSTNNQNFSYDLTVKTLVSDLPCEKCNCNNECTASIVLDASTYYTFTYCASLDDCSTNHTQDYIFGDKLVILITSKIGKHDFEIYSMYVYYPIADSDTVGEGFELPRDDIILQERADLTRKYTYKISQQAGYFEKGKQAKFKILLANSTSARRLLTETTEVQKIDYAITVNEDNSVQTPVTNGWNDVFEISSYVFMAINLILLSLLVALGKRWWDVRQSVKLFDQENQQEPVQPEQPAQPEQQQLVNQKEPMDVTQKKSMAEENHFQNMQIIEGANYFESNQLNQQAFQQQNLNQNPNNQQVKDLNSSTHHDQDSANGN